MEQLSLDNRPWLIKAFGNPYVGMVGWAASVLGLLLSIYFAHQSTKRRDFVYYVNPAQAVVVKTGEASRLRVLYGDQELKSDVTAAQVALWNQGNESIRPENVLQTVAIATEPSVPILEASVRKKSRDVVSIQLDQSRLSQGILGLSWNILEKNDGAVIQLVYAGPPSVQLVPSGVIEGQAGISRPKSWEGTNDFFKGKRLPPYFHQAFGWTLIGLGFVMFSFMLFRYRRTVARTRDIRIRVVRLLLLFAPILYVGMGIFELVFRQPPNPPFGF